MLETTLVYQDEKDGKWYYYGSDDCQELRLIDLKKRTNCMFMFTGTNFVDGAFWKNNDCFIIIEYDSYNYCYMFMSYDLKSAIHTVYRLKTSPPEYTEDSYLTYDMKTRGIIVK